MDTKHNLAKRSLRLGTWKLQLISLHVKSFASIELGVWIGMARVILESLVTSIINACLASTMNNAKTRK